MASLPRAVIPPGTPDFFNALHTKASQRDNHTTVAGDQWHEKTASQHDLSGVGVHRLGANDAFLF